MLDLDRRLIFVFGKGGVGRTTVSTALGLARAARGEKTLLVQWAIQDSISPLLGAEPCEHRHVEVRENLYVMNFSGPEALREYFVEHLGMKLFYKMIIENNQVRRLIHAAPGLEELFFFGRLFWLVELARDERNIYFDRIIVDAPATGHGSALFGIVGTVSKFDFEGPLVNETRRVTNLILDADKTGALLVTLPEELPVDETLEFLPVLERDLQRPPLALIMNRSLIRSAEQSLRGPDGVHAFSTPDGEPDWFRHFSNELQSMEARAGANALLADLQRRLQMEKRTRQSVTLPVLSLPDVLIQQPGANPVERIAALVPFFEAGFAAPRERT